MGEVCRHFAVNHSKEWRSVAAVHTNHAEGVHGVIKRYLLQQHNRFGISSRNVRKHVALQCCKLLNAEVEPALPTGHTNVTYTKSAAKDKRAKKDVAGSSKKILAPTKDLRTAFLEDMTALLLHSEVIVDALQWMLQPGYAIVDPRVALSDVNHVDMPIDKTILWPVFYPGHWILAVLNYDSRTFPVYDSFRAFAHGPRTTALARIQQAIKKRWGTWPQLKPCDQQEKGSNDCGIHTIQRSSCDGSEKDANEKTPADALEAKGR